MFLFLLFFFILDSFFIFFIFFLYSFHSFCESSKQATLETLLKGYLFFSFTKREKKKERIMRKLYCKINFVSTFFFLILPSTLLWKNPSLKKRNENKKEKEREKKISRELSKLLNNLSFFSLFLALLVIS